MLEERNIDSVGDGICEVGELWKGLLCRETRAADGRRCAVACDTGLRVAASADDRAIDFKNAMMAGCVVCGGGS